MVFVVFLVFGVDVV